MPHVAFVPFTGLRVREAELLELGMRLPGLKKRATALSQLPALGLLTLAGMTPPDWTCSYHPASGDGEELAESVAQQRPDLVAISALTASVEEAYAFSRRMRARGIRTVIGGLHVSACPDEAQQHCDGVVAGEGEPVWGAVVHDAANGGLRPIYRSARAAKLEWAMPRFDLLKPQHVPRFTVQTERGCPLACDFCGASRLISTHRLKPVEAIVRELDAIAQLDDSPWIELADDNTFVGRDDCDELLDALGRSRARWFTEADWRIGEQPELLARLADAGCVQVLVGIESLVFRFPGMGRKGDELPRLMDAVARIQDAGVCVNGCFILGADGETHASMDRLVEFIVASRLAEVQLTLQTPFPGTALHNRLARAGRLLPDRGWPHYTLFDVTYQPDCLSVAELELAFRRVISQVFSPEASARREQIRREIWSRSRAFRSAARSAGEIE